MAISGVCWPAMYSKQWGNSFFQPNHQAMAAPLHTGQPLLYTYCFVQFCAVLCSEEVMTVQENFGRQNGCVCGMLFVSLQVHVGFYLIISMVMMVVSTRDFRTNQTKYLNMAKAGESVVLRSRSGSFKISPISADEDLSSQTEFKAQLRHALQEVMDARQGKLQLQSAEDLLNEL